MMKRFFIPLLMAVMAMLPTKASAQIFENIQELASLLSTAVPMDVGNGIVMKSVDYDPEINTLYMVYDWPQPIFDLAVSNRAKHPDTDEEGIINLINMLNMFGLPQNQNFGVNLKYCAPDGQSFTISCTYADMVRLRDQIASGDVSRPSLQETIERDIASTRAQLPLKVDEVTTLTQVGVIKGNVVYVYEVDPMLWQIVGDKAAFGEVMKQQAMQSLLTFYTAYADDIIGDNMNFIYSYVSPSGKEELTVYITPRDLFPERFK